MAEEKTGEESEKKTDLIEKAKKEKRYGPYTAKVIDHFKNPRNEGTIEDADANSKVGSPMCGDELWLYLKIEKKKGGKDAGELYIKDIKFQSFGCAASVATGSMMTEIAKGKTLKKALKLRHNEITRGLGTLPRVKIHCSLLSTDALHEAIYNYYKEHGIHIPEELEKLHQKIIRGNVIARQKAESEIDYCEEDDEKDIAEENH